MSLIITKDELENVTLGQEMKIEHYKPKNQYPELELTYRNLLGACNGNAGMPKYLQYCDTHKSNYDADRILTINPTLTICEQQVKFKSTGEIYSDDKSIDNDLTEILNLNCDFLIQRRKRTFNDWLVKFSKQYPEKIWTKSILQPELDKWENTSLDEYRPYCQIVIAYLKKKIKTAS